MIGAIAVAFVVGLVCGVMIGFPLGALVFWIRKDEKSDTPDD